MDKGLGLGRLDTLRRLLLPPLEAGQTENNDFDLQLQLIGSGVSDALEQYCKRKFDWLSGDVIQVPAPAVMVSLPRYPLKDVSRVEVGGKTWEDVTDQIASFDPESGIVKFQRLLGTDTQMIRVTYSGGYDIDNLRQDSGGGRDLPSGIVLAWQQQCSATWEQFSKFGNLTPPKESTPSWQATKLTDYVKELLAPHRRMVL